VDRIRERRLFNSAEGDRPPAPDTQNSAEGDRPLAADTQGRPLCCTPRQTSATECRRRGQAPAAETPRADHSLVGRGRPLLSRVGEGQAKGIGLCRRHPGRTTLLRPRQTSATEGCISHDGVTALVLLCSESRYRGFFGRSPRSPMKAKGDRLLPSLSESFAITSRP
jgi:hypothetical protein